MCLNNNQNVGNLLLFVLSHGGVKMTGSFAAVFVVQKLGKKNQSCCKEVFVCQLHTKLDGRLKFVMNGR